MGKAIRVSVLIILFSCSAQAGWMGNGAPEPPPSQPIVAQENYTPNGSPEPSQPTSGVEETPANGLMGGEVASLTRIALDLFAVLPSLL